MPAIVACPNCQTKYNLPEKFLGKAIKCKSCDKAFKTRAPGAAKQAAPKTAQKIPAALKNQASAEELARLGIDGPLKSQPDIFAAAPPTGMDPLGNHVVQDPGFRSQKKRKKNDSDEEMNLEEEGLSDLYENSAVAQQARLKGGKDKYKRKKEDKLLKSYMREDLFAEDREDEDFEPEIGINRNIFFWSSLGLNGLANGLTYIVALASGMESDEVMGQESLEQLPIVMNVLLILLLLIFGGGFGLLTYSRFKNMGFTKKLWPMVAACVGVLPAVLFLLAVIVSMCGLHTLAGITMLLSFVTFLPVPILGYMNIALPPDFVKTRQYDVTAWVWTALTILPFIGLIGLLGMTFLF